MTESISVALLDTGVDTAKMPLGSCVRGINLSGDGNIDDTIDRHGHGTDMAKTILSLAPSVKIVPVKILVDFGYLRIKDNVNQVFQWLEKTHREKGIAFVCVGFADKNYLTEDSQFTGSTLQLSIAKLRKNGVITIAPAGNRVLPDLKMPPPTGMGWPGILRDVVSVGAAQNEPKDNRLTLHPISRRLHANESTGCRTTVFAIPSTPGETSGATATVTGELCRLKTENPEQPPEHLLDTFLGSCLEATDQWSDLNWPVARFP